MTELMEGLTGTAVRPP